MTKTELKKTVVKIKKLLKQRDYGNIDTGIELARGLNEPAVFEALLGGWSINDEGNLKWKYGYKGETLIKRWSYESWPYFAYTLINLIGYAPNNTRIDESLKRCNIETFNFQRIPQGESTTTFEYGLGWVYLPQGFGLLLQKFRNLTSLDLSYNRSLQNVDGLSNCNTITSLDLSTCDYLQNVNGLANFIKLTNLKLCDCDSLQNLDGISNCTNLVSLDLSNCEPKGSLKNLDGIANLTSLTSLNLSLCDSLQNVNGLANLTNLTSLDLSWTSFKSLPVLASLTNLTSLNLRGCGSLKNVDVLANLINLTSLDLSANSLQNLDGLSNCTNLTSLSLSWCDSLQNVDGLTNCTNLTTLDLSNCNKVHPKPFKSIMSTREEVAAYQEEIKKSVYYC